MLAMFHVGQTRRRVPQPKKIAPDVYCMETGKGIMQSNVYFVRSGSSWALIDTAWANSAQSIKKTAESLFGANTRPASILMTHWHPDHAGSALELAQMWGCPLYLHPDELPMGTGDISILEQFAGPIDRRVVLPLIRVLPKRWAESMLKQPNFKDIAHAFDLSTSVPGLPDWKCIPTPGHTPGHVSFFRASDRVLITGDAVVTMKLNSLWGLLLNKQGLSGPPWYTTWSWQEAKESVAVLAKLEPLVLACGHGLPMTSAGTARDLQAFADHFQ
jgi:glyoxylase-like metal-dependent hydrolase (beta-lactamase superfamily II)